MRSSVTKRLVWKFTEGVIWGVTLYSITSMIGWSCKPKQQGCIKWDDDV